MVNIGLEGMMILGTWGGAWGALEFGVWAGILVGAIGGALGGLLHAVATVTFSVDQIVSGVAITILSLGLARYLASFTFAKMPGGGVTQSPNVPRAAPVLGAGRRVRSRASSSKGWFLISDIAGILRGLLTDVSALTLIAVILVPVTYYLLWRTPFGLRLRSCGENPQAAESLGVNVYRYKYYGVVISGAMAGLGGAFLSMVASSIYREGQTAGRGYIGLATMIFGNWRPGGLAAGAALFGYTDALQLRRGSESVHALLLLHRGGPGRDRRRSSSCAAAARSAWSACVLAVLAAVWYVTTDLIPVEFVQAMPYVITLVVLALASQRLRPPAADGQPYRKGEG